jgi:hypothetical protein
MADLNAFMDTDDSDGDEMETPEGVVVLETVDVPPLPPEFQAGVAALSEFSDDLVAAVQELDPEALMSPFTELGELEDQILDQLGAMPDEALVAIAELPLTEEMSPELAQAVGANIIGGIDENSTLLGMWVYWAQCAYHGDEAMADDEPVEEELLSAAADGDLYGDDAGL